MIFPWKAPKPSGQSMGGPGYLGGGGSAENCCNLKKNKLFPTSSDLVPRNTKKVADLFTPASQTYEIHKIFASGGKNA